MKTALVVLLSLMICVPVFAAAPINGTYKSTDLGGTMLTGRYSESWFPTALQINNTLNEESWDGATLGTQWKWYCPWIIAAPVLLFDNVVGGNGLKIWRVTYADGVCWLDGSGPWGGGDPSYTASIDTWIATITQTWVGGVVAGATRTHSATATFSGFNEECMTLSVSNIEMTGNTDSSSLPANYPNFWFWTPCSDIGTAGPGEWGDVEAITFTIDGCDVVPVQNKSWGAIKSIYKN